MIYQPNLRFPANYSLNQANQVWDWETQTRNNQTQPHTTTMVYQNLPQFHLLQEPAEMEWGSRRVAADVHGIPPPSWQHWQSSKRERKPIWQPHAGHQWVFFGARNVPGVAVAQRTGSTIGKIRIECLQQIH